MRRREITGVLLSSALTSSLSQGRSRSTPNVPSLSPIDETSSLAHPRPPWIDATLQGCALDGATDDSEAFKRCLQEIGNEFRGVIISGPMRINQNIRIPANVMLQFVGAGRLIPGEGATIRVEGDLAVGAVLPPWDLSAPNSSVITPVTRVLGATEGVTSTSYISTEMHGLVVPPNNPSTHRYWTANFTLEIPAESNIDGDDERQDHLAISGHAISSAKHSNIWAVVGAAATNCRASSNIEAGTCIGAEFDVNNDSGHDVANLNGGGDIGGLMVASGGKNVAKFGMCMSKLSSSKGFFTGWLVREGSIDPRGFVAYFGGISPTYGFNFGPDYSGGSCLISPVGINAVEMRTSDGNNVRMLSVGSALQFNGGRGGTIFSNNDDTRVNASLSNSGLLKAFALAHSQQKKMINSEFINSSLGGQVICADVAKTDVTSITIPESAGQQMTIIARTGNTVISARAAKLSTNSDFAMPRDGVLRLEWDGEHWYEIGRKV